MKKLITLLLTSALMLSLVACSTSEETTTNTQETEETTAPTYTIGISQLVQHAALDAATQGFIAAVSEKIGAENVTFDVQNASGDSATTAVIANQFVSDGVDLILANATAPLQSAAAATGEIPIIGTSITNYATALEITDWTGTTGVNISGASDLAPINEQAQMIKELFPEATKVGILYCSGEPNSVYQKDLITPELEALGFETEVFTFADSNDLAAVTTSAVSSVDVIYIPTDNTAASNTEIIKNIVVEAKVPVVAGEENTAAGCGVASLSLDYFDIGYKSGEMAVEVLVNGADISSMEIGFANEFTKKYNTEIAAELGITIPADYVAIEIAE